MRNDTVALRWLATADVAADQWPALAALLDDAERERAGQFHVEADRQSYIAAHALLRRMLSDRLPVAPSDWQFTLNPQGKPEAVLPPEAPAWRLNLSHTRGMVAVALAIGHEVGVDVERRCRHGLSLDLAHQFFAPDEVAMLHSLPAEELDDGLIETWTLKEAVIKAMGLGLSMSLQAFSVRRDRLDVTFAPAASPEDGWLLRRMTPAPDYALALALRHPAPDSVSIDVAPAFVQALVPPAALVRGEQ